MNIVITGASKGIGKAIAQKFAGNGYSLYLCARTEGPLKTLAESLIVTYPSINVYYRTCDVSVKEEVQSFASWILSKTDTIDVLVNNAGTFIQGHVHDEPEGILEELMATNLYSAYYLTRALTPYMKKKRSGHIFNICSIASLKAYEYGGSYSITKYAMAGFSTNLRDELKQFNIKVTSVFPGAAYTASWDTSDIDPDRLMKAEDIAELIYTSAHLSPQACVEEIVVRPQLGDL